MNWKLLGTMVTLIGVGASVALGQGTTPTIVQGDYISNVFGNSNFIKNPNAKLNNANITVSNATVTRSTTTPLVATSEFNITTSTSTGYADWSTRTFDAGMKGQNCEARFSYRGFSVGSTTAQILQGANVVAQLTLTASTDPRIASINFPCGDLSSATTFRLQQATASLTGTNEIGGIYVGLATNMANVAQAELIGTVTFGGDCTFARTANTFATPSDASCSATASGNVAVVSGVKSGVTITNAKPGNYRIVFNTTFYASSSTNLCRIQTTDGTTSKLYYYYQVPNFSAQSVEVLYEYTSTANRTIEFQLMSPDNTSSCGFDNAGSGQSFISVYRFPSSSELVVTPERQNVFGGVVYTAENQEQFSGTAEPTSFSPFNNSTWNKPAKLVGKAQVTTTNSGNDLGFSIPNLPVGSYKITISGMLTAKNNGSADTNANVACSFRVVETDSSGTVRTEVARQVSQDFTITTATDETRDFPNSFFGVYNNTAVATRNFRLEAQKWSDGTTGNIGACQAYSNTVTNSFNTNIAFLLEPLDQPSNSALYVQGPVLGAQTGAAIPASYVGQEVVYSTANTNYPNASGIEDAISNANLTLTPGVWEVSAMFTLQKNTAIFTGADLLLYISSTGVAQSYLNNAARHNAYWSTSMNTLPVVISPMRVRYDGTTMTFPNGSTATTNTIRVFAYLATFTGTPQYSLVFRAVRVN